MSSRRDAWLRRLVGLSHRSAYAFVLAVGTWIGYFSFPPGRIPRVVELVVFVANLPIAVSTHLLPYPFWGMDLIWGQGVGEFMSKEEMLLWHIRASIPVYVFIFYWPNILRWVVGTIRKARATPDGPTA